MDTSKTPDFITDFSGPANYSPRTTVTIPRTLDSDYFGAAGQGDSDEAGGNRQARQAYGFKPLDGERMFFKEAVSYKGETAEGSSSSFPSVKVKEETEPVDPEVREQVKIDESDDSSEENLPSRISSTQGRREQGVCK